MSWVTELAGSEYTCSLKTLYACQFYWVYGTQPMPASLGRIILNGIFVFGWDGGRGVDIQNFLYSRLINCFQYSKGGKNLLHPWLRFSFIHDNLDWREVCWLPRLPGQASGSKFSVKSSSCPLGRWKSAKISPENHCLGVLIALDTQPPSPRPSPMSTQSFKAWGLCELCTTEDNGPPIQEKPVFPKVSPAPVWHHNDSPLPDQTLSPALILFQLMSWVVLGGSGLIHLPRSYQVG